MTNYWKLIVSLTGTLLPASLVVEAQPTTQQPLVGFLCNQQVARVRGWYK
jgi:hypothetical protein